MTILVTGATGFVGAAVARLLVAKGHKVRVLARACSNRHNLDGLDVELAIGDLRDRMALQEAVEGCSGLFHVAADYRLWTRDVTGMYAVNVRATRDIIRAAQRAGVERVVYTSSVATLGLPSGGGAGDETTPVTLSDMIGHYKRSKFLAERAVRDLVLYEGAPVVVVNPSTPVGPGDVKPTPTGRMIVEAASGRMPGYVDTGLNIVHVDDVAQGHWLAWEKGTVGEKYILGGDNMALRDILTEITALTDFPPPRLRIPYRAVIPFARLAEAWCRVFGGEPFATVDGVKMARKRMYFSSEKARRDLGYAPRPAKEALADAVAWFRAHGYLGE